MKKAFLVSALAVALASCGGNSNQNQGNAQSADSTNAQNVESQPSASPINVGDIEGYPANEVSKILNCPDDEEWLYPPSDPSEDAWKGETADRNAKVSLIKIYKRGGFCETCRNLNEQQKTDLIRKMYNAVANDQELTKKHIQVEDEESGYPVDYDYFYKGDRLVMVEVSSGDGTMVDKKIYVDDDCSYFCLIETRYPDGSNAFDRIYICGGIIYKYLDNSKKELPLTSEVMHREQKSISHLLLIAKNNESKAK